MTEYELWIDESGRFDGDDVRNKRSGMSLVGGVLIPKSSGTDEWLEQLIPKTFHSTLNDKRFGNEKKKEAQLKIFDGLKENKNIKFVIFRNQKRVVVMDRNTTYINVLADGLSELIKELGNDISLDVLVATSNDGKTKVREEDYVKRIMERIMTEGHRRNILIKTRDYNTGNANAQIKATLNMSTCCATANDPGKINMVRRLSAADVVCNAFFTMDTTFREHSYVKSIFFNKTKTYLIDTFSTNRYFSDLMFEGRYGEAVLAAADEEDAAMSKKLLSDVADAFSVLTNTEMNYQYKAIANSIERSMNLAEMIAVYEPILKNIEKYFINRLKTKKGSGEYADKMAADLYFYFMTLYSHTGDIDGYEEYEKKYDETQKNDATDKDIANRISCDIRKNAFYLDLFEADVLIDNAKKTAELCEKFKNALKNFSDAPDNFKYGELGKIYGNMTQAYTMKFAHGDDCYAEALKYSELAMKEFAGKDDIQRQLFYRVKLETFAGKFDLAYDYLLKAYELDEGTTPSQLAEIIKKTKKHYGNLSYIRLCALGMKANWEKAEEMFGEYENRKMYPNANTRKFHPIEYTLKYYAVCMAIKQRVSAESWFKRAMDCCGETCGFTLKVIRLGIALERYGYSLKNNIMSNYSRKIIFEDLNKAFAEVKNDNYINKNPKSYISNMINCITLASTKPNEFFDMAAKLIY